MQYITVDKLIEYKTGFDLSGYNDVELLSYIEIASDLINDYLGHSFDYTAVVDEKGTGKVQSNGELFITLKSTNINTVTALSINAYGNTYNSVDLTYLNLYQKPGYFYITRPLYYYTGLGEKLVDAFRYKVSYTKVDMGIPKTVELATAKIVGNILRADYNLQNGISGSSKSIQSFTSGDYTVKLGGSSLSYQGKYNSSGGATDNPYIDDSIRALLHKFKKTSQNTY